jgi:phage repressor protein C with HTH and peptisase S24 domain
MPGVYAGADDTPPACRIADAEAVLALNPNWYVMRCEGDSMKPYLNENDLIIVERNSYQSLEPGMIVVYRDAAGDAVVHQIQRRVGDGFKVIGYNNLRSDSSLLTSANYAGSVVAILRGEELTAPELATLPVAFCKNRK